MKFRFIKWTQKPQWTGPLELFEIRCERHGVVWDYKHGFKQEISCPICRGMTHDGS